MSIVVGKVVGIKGEVLVLDTETQEVRVLSEGSELFLNEVVLTQEGATVAIETVDGNTLSIGSDSQFVIDNDVVPVEAFQELPEQLVGNFDSLQRAIVEGRFESVDGTEIRMPAEQQAAFQTQAEAINQSNNTDEELSSSNQQGVEDERNAETGEVTAGYVTDTREIDFEENVEQADRSTEELITPTLEPTPEPTEPPTETPTEEPTPEPTEPPTEAPTEAPTPEPTEPPTEAPTPEPTEPPTEAPTETPTEEPTPEPTEPPPPPRTVIKVVAADDQGNPLKDSEGNYLEANAAAEGGQAYYVALAFTPNSTVFNDNTRLATQAGTVDFAFTDDSATRNPDQDPAEGSNDYLQQETLEGIELNTLVSADALDDYISDNGELFNVTISNYQSSSPAAYAAVTVREEGVETTITDNSINNESEIPNDPTDPNNLDDGGEPNNPNEQTNAEPVVIKLIALDGNGEPILDPQTGEYTFANQVNEGSDAKYMALAFAPNETIFSPQTKLDNQLGTIDITFGADGDSATGAEEQTVADGSEDYDNTPQISVALGSVISTASFPDYRSDNEETYKVTIDQGSYTRPTPATGYEDVIIDQTPVTTAILDNEQNVFVKIINNDTQAESNFLSHTLQLVDSEGNSITVPDGETITVTLSYAGSGDDPAEGNDYTADTEVTIVGGTSETTFYNEALDDYLAENNEQYTVTIDAISQANNTYENVASHTIANGAPSDAISVTGTITDNDARNNLPPVEEGQQPGQPTNPEPTEPTDPDTPNEEDSVDNTPRFGPEDTVYVRILDDDSVAESEWLSHRVQLVDQNGNPVEVPAGEIITVALTYTKPDISGAIKQANGVENADYVATEIVTIIGGTSETTFTNESLEDYFAEGAESYTITIASVIQQAGSFENIEPEVDGNGDLLEVTGTINDNPAQDTENPDTPIEPTDPDNPNDPNDSENSNPVYGSEDSVYVKIIHDDTQSESNFLSHSVQLVDKNGDPVIVADGETITVSLSYAGSGTDHAEDNDYVATETVTIVGGTSETTFYNKALDDYFAENDEQYTVTINAATQDQGTYENLAIDTANDSVTGTITDNPAQDTENPNTPEEPTTPDNPEDPNDNPNPTPVYGPEDTVYVKILDDDTTQEGNSLSHRLQLVDQDGNPVNIPAGETITVTLTYTPAQNNGALNQNDNGDHKDYTATTSVQLTGNGNNSEVTFTNDSIIDFLNENDESYIITIDTITQANDTFENIVPARDGATFDDGNLLSVTGTITNDMTIDAADNAYVDEDDFVASNPNSSLTGTLHDNGGAADPDGNSSSGASTLFDISTGFENTEYAFAFEESLVLNSENDSNLSIPAGGTNELSSGGVALQYVTNGSTFTAYKGAGRTDADKVFDIVLSNNTNDDGSDDGYTYTQYQNIDHPIAGNTDTPLTSDDTLSLTFGYKVIGTNGNTNESAVHKFTVTVNDSLPNNNDQTLSVNEDNDKLIVISAEPFANGEIAINNNKDGLSTVANGNSINIYDADGNDLIGSVTNHGDGTITFTPETHFSGQASFDYSVSDRDNDTASATVTIDVLPIADGVTMQADKTGNDAIFAIEDNSNANDGLAQTNFAIGLGLALSTVIDASDETTTGTTTYDSIERQGLLDFVFDNADGTNDGYLVGLDTDGNGSLDTTLFTLGTDGNSFSIYITDGDFHPTNLDNNGAIQLTQAQYAQLAISPIEDSHHNVDFTITTESHEVTDAGALLSPDVISTSSTQNVTVDLQAMTDPVTIDLAVVNTGDTSVTLEDKQLADDSAGTDGHNDHINLTINEDTNDGLSYVNLKDIILERYGDIDGSENFKFEIWSEVNDGVKITVEGVSAKTISTTHQTFDFSKDNPYIRLDPPENFSGDLSTISIKLIALDNDTDSTVTETETSDVITLDVFVNPIADDVTLPNVSTTEDTAVKLFAGLDITDKTAGTESITQIVVNDLPAGWVLKDHGGAILLTGNGTDDITIDVTNVGLANVQNYTVTPPAHSSADIDLSVNVTVQDVQTVNSVLQTDTNAFNHTLNIKVTPVAEVTTPNDGSPSQTDSDGDGSNDLGLTAGHNYVPDTAKEDGNNGAGEWFTLGTDTGFNLETGWFNQDDTTDFGEASNTSGQTDSEQTFALLTFMAADGSTYADKITGSQYKYNDGTTDHIVTDTNGRVEIPAAYLDTLQIIAPAQLSGDYKILVEAKTVDYDENSPNDLSKASIEISGQAYLTFGITPVADLVTLQVKQVRGFEDAGRSDGNLDSDHIDKDEDGTFAPEIDEPQNGIQLEIKTSSQDPSETFRVNIEELPDGGALYVYDNSTFSWKLIEVSADGSTVTIDGTATSTSGDITVDNSGTGWKVTIDDFQNDQLPKFIPPHNSDANYALTVTAQTVDTATVNSATVEDLSSVSAPLTLNVNVVAQGDVVINQTLNTKSIDDTSDTPREYNEIVMEGSSSISLQSLFEDGANALQSYDNDDSESVFIRANDLPAGVSITGSGVVDTGSEYLIARADFANAQINIANSNFNGEISFDLYAKSIEETNNNAGTEDKIEISVLVLPVAKSSLNVDSSHNEDPTGYEHDLTLSFNQVGSNETLESVWVNTETFEDGVSLRIDNTTYTKTSAGSDQWVEIPIANIGDLTAILDSSVWEHKDGSYDFDFRYSVYDETPDNSFKNYSDSTNINDYADTFDANTHYKTATYTVTVNAVTDDDVQTDTGIGAIDVTDANVTQDANDVVIVDKAGASFTVPFSIKSEDQDESEEVQTIIVSGVPEGLAVVGGTYLGDTLSDNGNGEPFVSNEGRWEVPAASLTLGTNGQTYDIEFKAVGEVIRATGTQTITIDLTYVDNNPAANKTVSDSFEFAVDANYDSTGATYQNDTLNVMEVSLTPKMPSLTEDTDFNLGQLVDASRTDGSTSSKFAVLVSNLPAGYSSQGADETQTIDGTEYFVYYGDGDVTALNTLLGNITVSPLADDNVWAMNGALKDLDISVITYNSEAFGTITQKSVSETDIELPLAPVSDATTITIDKTDTTESDTPSAQTITIGFNNTQDRGEVEIKDNAVYVKFAETITDNDGNDEGLIEWNNAGNWEPLPATLVNGGTYDGYYAFTVNTLTDTLEFRYTAQADRFGTLDINVQMETKEFEDANYTTAFVAASANTTLSVAQTVSGLDLTDAKFVGDEDNLSLLTLTNYTVQDDAESVTQIQLKDVPFGYTVEYDGSAVTTKEFTGVGGNGEYLYTYTINPVDAAKLNTLGINVVDDHVSGSLNGVDIIFTIEEIGGATNTVEAAVPVTFNPVADGLTITPTLSFGEGYDWIELKLNANMVDVDGSETMTLTLSGSPALDGSMLFRLKHGTVVTASFDSGTYTLEGIAYDQINNLELLYHDYSGTITATAKTVDGTDESSTVLGTFDLEIAEATTIDLSGEARGITITGTDSDDTINGGNGTDTVIYSGLIGSYTFTYINNTTISISGSEGTDTLSNVEKLTFNGTTYTLAISDGNINVKDNSVLNLIISDTNDDDTITADSTDYIVSASTNGAAVEFSTLDDANSQGGANNGVIIDGIIEGMSYKTSSGITGTTDAAGGFKFNNGDTVTFSIGSIVIGTADAGDLAAGKVFLQDLANTDRTDLEDDYVQVMAVFLQTLDSEGNTAGGIQISDSAHQAFADESLNLSSMSLAQMNDLLVAHGYTPVDIETAMDHVMDMLVANTDLDEDDFVPFELQDEVIAEETLEKVIANEITEENSDIDETIPEETTDEDADEDATETPSTKSEETELEENAAEGNTDNIPVEDQGDTGTELDNDSDGSLLVDEELIIEDSVEEETETESDEPEADMPETSELFDTGEDEVPLPDAEETEEPAEEITPSPTDNDATSGDDSVVIQEKEAIVIEESQTDF